MSKPATSTDKRAVYMREWRAKNLERAKEIERASQARQRAADPEGFAQRARERYQQWIAKPGNREKNAQRIRDNRSSWRKSRRGLTLEERHEYWVYRNGICDFCGVPYVDPLLPGAWKHAVVDHDHDHCANKIGCLGCVRGQGHRPCNVAEGQIKRALDLGIITGIWGPLADYLADPPMQRWLRDRAALSVPAA